MFVRWQQYKSQALNDRQREHNDKRGRFSAVLVESVRIDGKPRQRHVAFLGSVQRDHADRPRFWHTVRATLDRLRITPKQRAALEAAVGKRVKPTTRAEQKAHEARRRALLRIR